MLRRLAPHEFPALLNEIPDKPKQLNIWGELPREGNKLLGIVGSRKYSIYGQEVCRSIVAGLAGRPITIVSGLALGMDSIAHRAALYHGLQTVAVPGSGLHPSVLHPRSHVPLAEEIVENGGGLISELDDTQPAGVWAFPKRNRIMAGMCHAVIVIEAGLKSGTLITSRLATEYNREVGAVPGPVSSPTSDGPHMLLRLGAALIRDSHDVLELLGMDAGRQQELVDIEELGAEEKILIKILESPCERDELVRKSKLSISQANAALTLMEIKGLIKEELGEVRKTF